MGRCCCGGVVEMDLFWGCDGDGVVVVWCGGGVVLWCGVVGAVVWCWCGGGGQ